MSVIASPVIASPHRTEAVPGLARLADRAEITDLVHRLAAALDERRYEDLGGLFTDEAAVESPGGTALGRSALVDQAVRNHRRFARTQHRMTDVLVEVDGDRARVRADAVARLMTDGVAPAVRLGAVYRWQVERSGEGWRFSRMQIREVWRIDDD